MEPIDIYFWRFFAFGIALGLVLICRDWLRLMGHGLRVLVFQPDLCMKEFRYLQSRLGTGTWSLKDHLPEPYYTYIVWREVCHSFEPPHKVKTILRLSKTDDLSLRTEMTT